MLYVMSKDNSLKDPRNPPPYHKYVLRTEGSIAAAEITPPEYKNKPNSDKVQQPKSEAVAKGDKSQEK